MKRRLCKKILRYRIDKLRRGDENPFKLGDYSQVGYVHFDAAEGKAFCLQQKAVSFFKTRILNYIKE